MSKQIKTRKELLTSVNQFVGQARAQWREATTIAADLFNYFLYSTEQRHDATIIGKMYNDLAEEHKPIAKAFKAAAADCCGIAFKADKQNEGRQIAYKNRKVWTDDLRVGDTTDEMDSAMLKLSAEEGKGLKEWVEVKRKTGTANSKHSEVFGKFQILDSIVKDLEKSDNPEAKEFLSSLNVKIMELMNEARSVLPKFAPKLASAMARAEAKQYEKQEKEESKAA